ncbi:helix-turn-helix domain-containing protein [Blautia sp. MSJ-19]
MKRSPQGFQPQNVPDLQGGGYDNPKYFFRIFKKKTGMTPEQYRERL